MIGLAIVLAIAVIAVVGWIGLRRHGESPVAAPGWVPTEESFRDPSTGRIMRVWVDPVDGSRHYVPELP
ncbi:MAG: hypothetical protein QOH66_513 [Actinomycetota bacterium]|nr:hypothetical protein [Actinomycetota bacterium]MEA2587586.1 hypothetical protein [Actinomycetota bacterium]